MTLERIEILKEFLQKWDFELMPLMPIAEPEAKYLLKLLEEKEKKSIKRHEYYVRNRDTYISKAKETYDKKKAQAFIKGVPHD